MALWLIFGLLCLVVPVVVFQLGLIAFHLGDLKAYVMTVIKLQQRGENVQWARDVELVPPSWPRR